MLVAFSAVILVSVTLTDTLAPRTPQTLRLNKNTAIDTLSKYLDSVTRSYELKTENMAYRRNIVKQVVGIKWCDAIKNKAD